MISYVIMPYLAIVFTPLHVYSKLVSYYLDKAPRSIWSVDQSCITLLMQSTMRKKVQNLQSLFLTWDLIYLSTSYHSISQKSVATCYWFRSFLYFKHLSVEFKTRHLWVNLHSIKKLLDFCNFNHVLATNSWFTY